MCITLKIGYNIIVDNFPVSIQVINIILLSLDRVIKTNRQNSSICL